MGTNIRLWHDEDLLLKSETGAYRYKSWESSYSPAPDLPTGNKRRTETQSYFIKLVNDTAQEYAYNNIKRKDNPEAVW